MSTTQNRPRYQYTRKYKAFPRKSSLSQSTSNLSPRDSEISTQISKSSQENDDRAPSEGVHIGSSSVFEPPYSPSRMDPREIGAPSPPNTPVDDPDMNMPGKSSESLHSALDNLTSSEKLREYDFQSQEHGNDDLNVGKNEEGDSRKKYLTSFLNLFSQPKHSRFESVIPESKKNSGKKDRLTTEDQQIINEGQSPKIPQSELAQSRSRGMESLPRNADQVTKDRSHSEPRKDISQPNYRWHHFAYRRQKDNPSSNVQNQREEKAPRKRSIAVNTSEMARKKAAYAAINPGLYNASRLHDSLSRIAERHAATQIDIDAGDSEKIKTASVLRSVDETRFREQLDKANINMNFQELVDSHLVLIQYAYTLRDENTNLRNSLQELVKINVKLEKAISVQREDTKDMLLDIQDLGVESLRNYRILQRHRQSIRRINLILKVEVLNRVKKNVLPTITYLWKKLQTFADENTMNNPDVTDSFLEDDTELSSYDAKEIALEDLESLGEESEQTIPAKTLGNKGQKKQNTESNSEYQSESKNPRDKSSLKFPISSRSMEKTIRNSGATAMKGIGKFVKGGGIGKIMSGINMLKGTGDDGYESDNDSNL